MSEAKAGGDYDRWLSGRSFSRQLYAFYASLPGMLLVNTPVFRLDRMLRLQPRQRVLDIACGRGSLLQVLASRVPFEAPPVGIDLSGEMLKLARRDLQKPSHAVSLAHATSTRLPFADGSFDIVTCAYMAKHVADTDLLRFLIETRRVLTERGIAVIWDFAPVSSERLNRLNRWLLTRGTSECYLRDYTQLQAFALGAGFEWVGNASLWPFFWPLIPRISLILGKTDPSFINH